MVLWVTCDFIPGWSISGTDMWWWRGKSEGQAQSCAWGETFVHVYNCILRMNGSFALHNMIFVCPVLLADRISLRNAVFYFCLELLMSVSCFQE